MTDKIVINDDLVEVTECDHIGIRIGDSGYGFLGRRDIGLHCDECGTEWDVQIKKGLEGATIKLRSAFEMTEHTLTKDEKAELDQLCEGREQ